MDNMPDHAGPDRRAASDPTGASNRSASASATPRP
jgi:hypothetical protein